MVQHYLSFEAKIRSEEKNPTGPNFEEGMLSHLRFGSATNQYNFIIPSMKMKIYYKSIGTNTIENTATYCSSC